MAFGDGVQHQGLPVARGLCGAAEARNCGFVIGRLHQLVGDEHLPATDIPLRRDPGALIELAKPRCRGQIIGAEITGGDQLPVLQLHGIASCIVPFLKMPEEGS